MLHGQYDLRYIFKHSSDPRQDDEDDINYEESELVLPEKTLSEFNREASYPK